MRGRRTASERLRSAQRISRRSRQSDLGFRHGRALGTSGEPLGALLAYVVLALLVIAGWNLLQTNGLIYPDEEDIAQACEERAAKRHAPETIEFRRVASSCRSQMETDPFG